ncbi:hypothetical protein [Natrinema sp. 1APR25-10V2]|uniref:hypothetical protein n=1 Tax=Natrinema sp. 1APR25-10V2 TaxID=2951081 RepID=UPI0028742805|nr:hypothetical protein [Natrinema sp. 1APR25-10V2]MDS0478546.1 hypothetical protein [Natrinema sp. 1APR25-10V2]
MSANGDGNGDDEVPGREIAYRLFAAEYDDASLSYAESDEERAPNYVISPTGARLNRVFAVGTLTEVTSVNDEMVRARVVDPTGAFVVYAGQYQPDELAFLEQTEPPAFVAVTGKARTFQPDDSDQVYTSIRPESIATVDADTRDRWVVSAAERTLERVGTYAAAAELEASGDALTDALLEAGVESGLAAGIPLAQDHYGTTPSYLAALRECAIEACEVVAGDRDQVSGLDVAPDGTSPEFDVSFDSLADLERVDADALETGGEAEPEPESAEPAPEPEPATATPGGGEPDAASEEAHSGSAAGTAASAGSETTDVDTEPVAATASSESESTASDVDEPSADAGVEEPADEGTGEASDEIATAPEEEDLGDFDAGDADDGGMYEMDDEEREELEEQFGAEFTTGSEVDEPGTADIDVPEPDESGVGGNESESEPAADAGNSAESDDELGAPPESGLEATDADGADEIESDAETDAAAEDESTAEPEAAPADESEAGDVDEDEEPAEDVDLESYVVETMEQLDDGSGADRDELIETVAADTGASEDDVEDAIQDALMGGQCYEPDDETLKAI